MIRLIQSGYIDFLIVATNPLPDLALREYAIRVFDFASDEGCKLARLVIPVCRIDYFLPSGGAWSGPFRSGFGWHLVYVQASELPRVWALSEVLDTVRGDFQAQTRERLNAEAFDKLRRKYIINWRLFHPRVIWRFLNNQPVAQLFLAR